MLPVGKFGVTRTCDQSRYKTHKKRWGGFNVTLDFVKYCVEKVVEGVEGSRLYKNPEDPTADTPACRDTVLTQLPLSPQQLERDESWQNGTLVSLFERQDSIIELPVAHIVVAKLHSRNDTVHCVIAFEKIPVCKSA